MQLENISESFEKFDTDGDGFIDITELGNSLKELGQPMNHKELARLIEKFDDQGTNKLG